MAANIFLRFFFPSPAVELSVWPVCLAPFFSKLWKSCWKLMLPLLLSFFLFFLFSSSAYGCWQGVSFRWEQKSVAERLLIEPSFLESEGLRWAGVPGNTAGSWSAANPEVLAAACFCTHCLLMGMIIQPLITKWVSPFSSEGTDHLIYGFNGKKMWVNQGINQLLH